MQGDGVAGSLTRVLRSCGYDTLQLEAAVRHRSKVRAADRPHTIVEGGDVRRGLMALAAAALVVLTPPVAEAKLLFRMHDVGTITMGELVEGLKAARVVFFGERHSNVEDHVAQRTLIQALHEAGVPLAIGMEMFRNDAQPSLDRWIAGTLEERAFRAVYDDNWDRRLYEQYREILLYARQERIPIVGLNIARRSSARSPGAASTPSPHRSVSSWGWTPATSPSATRTSCAS
jgi:hypothetical protein